MKHTLTFDGTDITFQADENDAQTITRIILSMATGPDISLMEMVGAAEALTLKADPEAQIIWGHVVDESLGENVRVSIIAAK